MTEPSVKITEKEWCVSEDPREGMEWNNHIVLAEDRDMRVAFMAHGGPDRAEEFAEAALLMAQAPALFRATTQLRAALRRLIEEWPDVTKATWDIAQRALADQPAAAAEQDEDYNERPSAAAIRGAEMLRQLPTPYAEPSEAEVEAATEAICAKRRANIAYTHEWARAALAAAAKVRAR